MYSLLLLDASWGCSCHSGECSRAYQTCLGWRHSRIKWMSNNLGCLNQSVSSLKIPPFDQLLLWWTWGIGGSHHRRCSHLYPYRIVGIPRRASPCRWRPCLPFGLGVIWLFECALPLPLRSWGQHLYSDLVEEHWVSFLLQVFEGSHHLWYRQVRTHHGCLLHRIGCSWKLIKILQHLSSGLFSLLIPFHIIRGRILSIGQRRHCHVDLVLIARQPVHRISTSLWRPSSAFCWSSQFYFRFIQLCFMVLYFGLALRSHRQICFEELGNL